MIHRPVKVGNLGSYADFKHLQVTLAIWTLFDARARTRSPITVTSWWVHGTSNHQRLDCLFSRSSGAEQRKHHSSSSLAFVREIHWWTVDSPLKGPHAYDRWIPLFYHDVGEIFWPQPIRSLRLGHVTGQGSMSPTWVGRVSDPGKIAFIKRVKTWMILLYIWLHL